MRRVIRFVVRLYPARWRGRYGIEFDALLEDVNLEWRDLLDVVRGALKKQLAMGSMSGMAAVFGVAGALLAGAVAITMPDKYVSTADLRVGSTPGTNHDAALHEIETVTREVLNRSSLAGIIERQHL